jgi:hypothetical protein
LDEDADHVHREQGRGVVRACADRPGVVLEDRADAVLRRKVVPEPEGVRVQGELLDVESGERYWISGPRKDGADRLYDEALPVEIDEDVRIEYWTEIRGMPSRRWELVASR